MFLVDCFFVRYWNRWTLWRKPSGGHRRRADELEAALEDALRRRRDAEEDGRAALERQRRDKDDQLEHLQHVTDPRFGIDIVYFRSLDVLYLSNSANLVSHFKDNNEILLENRSFHVL